MKYFHEKATPDNLDVYVKDIIEKNSDIKVLLRLEQISDETTYYHSLDVAVIANKMLTAYEEAYNKPGLFNEIREDIIKGALLHDIGKVFIPLGLMLSPKKFTSEEKDIANLHTTLGGVILDGLFSQIVTDITMYHHNPYLLISEDERKTAMIYIIYVADIFEALISARPYKQAYPVDSALGHMENDDIPSNYLSLLKTTLNES